MVSGRVIEVREVGVDRNRVRSRYGVGVAADLACRVEAVDSELIVGYVVEATGGVKGVIGALGIDRAGESGGGEGGGGECRSSPRGR